MLRGMRALLATTLLLSVCRPVFADASARGKGTLGFVEHGFAIDPPAGHDAAQTQQVVTLSMPTSDGFSPNVNVQVQPFNGTVEEYVNISREQFKTMGIKLVSEKHDARTATIEYSGSMQGRPLHWYARAFLGKSGLILATATALESQWAATRAALRQSVDSVRPLP